MRVSASLVSPPQPRRRADVLPERVWRQQQLLARRLRRRCPPLSQPRATYAPICALFRTRPTLVGEDRPSSASRASSGASLSSDGASPMLPPAPASQPARGRHRRPHALTLVVGAFFCVVPVDMGRWAMAGLVAGHTGPSGGQYARVQNRGGAAAARSLSGRRAHGSVARLGPHRPTPSLRCTWPVCYWQPWGRREPPSSGRTSLFSLFDLFV